MNIYGKKVMLRATEKTDCDLIRTMFNDPELEDLVVGWAFPVSSYAQEQWLNAHYNDKNSFRFIIETKEDGPVGIATLIDIDWKNRRAEHGIKICSNATRSKGIGTDTVMAIMRYAFDELGLHRLDGCWFDTNVASKSLYKKCGWVEEGIRREYVFKKGAYRDLTVVGIIAEEYYALIEKNNYWDDEKSRISID